MSPGTLCRRNRYKLEGMKALQVKELRTLHTAQVGFLLLLCNIISSEDGKIEGVIEGIGQFGGKDVDITVELFHRRVAPSVAGDTFVSPTDATEKVLAFEFNYKMMGVQLSKAICGLDTALWECFAKVSGVSVSQYVRSSVLNPPGNGFSQVLPFPFPVYASSINRSVDVKVLCKELVRLQQVHGIQAFKVKVGKRMSNSSRMSEEEIEQLGKVLETMGSAKVAIDCNGAYRDCESISPLLMDEFSSRLWFLEEPFKWFHYEEYRRLKDKTLLILAGGEQEFRRDVWARERGLFNICQPDIGYSGGLSAVLEVHKLNQVVIPHSPQGDLMPLMSWHLLCALKQADTYLELGCVNDGLVQVALDKEGIFQSSFFNEAFKVRNGEFSLDSDVITGWGVTLKNEWRSKAIERAYDPVKASDRSFL